MSAARATRARGRVLLAPLLLHLAVACNRHPSASATPFVPSARAAASTVASGSSDASAGAGPTEGLGNPPHLADADIATLESGLHCTPGSPPRVAGPCEVLVAMEQCGEWVVPTADGRWLGHGWQTIGAATVHRVTIVRSRAVPQADVKPWQLPVKIAIGAIDKDDGPAFAQAGAAVGAYAHHAALPVENAAIAFVKRKSDWTDESSAARTMGSMVETFSDHPAYLCRGPDRLELLQQASADIGLKPDGLYAELWPVSP